MGIEFCWLRYRAQTFEIDEGRNSLTEILSLEFAKLIICRILLFIVTFFMRESPNPNGESTCLLLKRRRQLSELHDYDYKRASKGYTYVAKRN